MALTRPNMENILTNVAVFTDSMTVLHQGATQANIDVGFVFNRASGLVPNAAFYWSESTQSMVIALTANAGGNFGSTPGNIAVQTYSNLTMGNVFVNNRVDFVWQNNNASAVYQVFNSTTNSLDTIFG